MAEGLTELGWVVHRATDQYPNDAQEINDEDWLEYGLRNGWTPLCKDGRINGRRHSAWRTRGVRGWLERNPPHVAVSERLFS